jgi:hypothetical protein
MSSDWNDPEMNLAGLRLCYANATHGGAGTMSLQQFADVALAWAAKADAKIIELTETRVVYEMTGYHNAETLRRELAEKILLKLIEIAPTAFETDAAGSVLPEEGIKLAWSIADAFLKAEGQ